MKYKKLIAAIIFCFANIAYADFNICQNRILETEVPDSCQITFHIYNPFNSNKPVPGVIVKLNCDSWVNIENIRASDKNGTSKIKMSREHVHERIYFYYTAQFYFSLIIPFGSSFKDTVINIYLKYKNPYVSSSGNNKYGYTPYFCSNLDSLDFSNCRYIDISNSELRKVPGVLRKYRKDIVIIILDGNNISKIPKYLRIRTSPVFISYIDTDIDPAKNKYKRQVMIYSQAPRIAPYSNYFFGLHDLDILYSYLHYNFFLIRHGGFTNE